MAKKIKKITEEKEILDIYKQLGIKGKNYPHPFNPEKLGEEYQNFTIYKPKNFNYTTSSSSHPISTPVTD